VDRKQAAMVKMLVDRGADPFSADVGGTSAAQVALQSDINILDAMFNSKNINNTGPDGRTILHYAADALMPKEVDLLLSKGASVQIKDKADRTALDLVLLYPDKIEAAQIAEKLILKGANPSFPEFSWFAVTVRAPDYNAVRFSNGNTPLHEAISRYQSGFALFLLLNKIDPDLKNLNGEAPLHLAVKSGYVEGAQLLLKNRANPDILDANQNTPLHLTIPPARRLEMVKLLLSYKANLTLMDNKGNTPLHKAVMQFYTPGNRRHSDPGGRTRKRPERERRHPPDPLREDRALRICEIAHRGEGRDIQDESGGRERAQNCPVKGI
jgi:ankyrin repeat protein